MCEPQTIYVSYLLRLWSVNDDGHVVWRASVESGLTGERQAFASLEELCDFLRQQTEASVLQTGVGSDEVKDAAP